MLHTKIMIHANLSSTHLPDMLFRITPCMLGLISITLLVDLFLIRACQTESFYLADQHL